MGKQRQIGPTIVALKHHPYATANEELKQQIQKLFEVNAREKKTVFIETSHKRIPEQKYLGRIEIHEPFFYIIWYARKEGWDVVGFERDFHTDLMEKANELERKDLKLRQYIVFNLREKYWAKKIRRMKPKSRDLIVIHPNHVKGFLIEYGISARNVIWLHRPEPEGYLWGWGRINSREVRKLKALRKKKRIKRARKPELYRRKRK